MFNSLYFVEQVYYAYSCNNSIIQLHDINIFWKWLTNVKNIIEVIHIWKKVGELKEEQKI